MLLNRGVQISMDSAGAYVGNVFVERLWRSVKDEEVCLKAYESVIEAIAGIGACPITSGLIRLWSAELRPRCPRKDEA